MNFSKLATANAVDTILHPREIFAALPNKNARYQYPRDVQSEVWTQWFERRSDKDLVIRMNTGGGKTVVALLILKSCLNENVGPAVYIAPDQFLTAQVFEEAKQLGIEVTHDHTSARFQRGKAILVTTIRTLFNGQSVFGVGTPNVPIGSLVIDDAHACLEATESQFTMQLDGAAHARLLAMFREDLRQQSETLTSEIERNENRTYMQVPYWAWANKQRDVVSLFGEIEQNATQGGEAGPYSEATRSAFRFNYPLIKSTLHLCRCVMTGGATEISPRILPNDIIASFSSASRRIVMSATLADDSILVSHFDLTPAAITGALTPLSANDIGDRMILVPQELNPDFTDDVLKALLVDLSKSRNVVVVVPSNYRAKYWESDASLVLRASNLSEGVARLRRERVGLVVLVNKYDGIDLPKAACEVLVIDGLPDVRRGIDKVEEVVLLGTDQILSQRIQRIEQGMGRGVRSNDDYCLVFLMGKTLTSFLYKVNGLQKFGSATRAQLALSDKVSDDLHGKPIGALVEVIQQFLARDQDWIKASKGTLANLKYEQVKEVSAIVIAQRDAFALSRRNDFSGAERIISNAVNKVQDPRLRGWLRQQLAEVYQFIDPAQSQLILKAAIKDNLRVLRPIGGIEYQRLPPSAKAQTIQCWDYIKNTFNDGNALILEVDSLISQLIFQPETSNAFEEALKDIGLILGFNAHRPEKEFGRGPDVLWEAGDGVYFINECKNGVTSDGPINKHDCNQMNGSIVWFEEHYKGAQGIPFLIHPSTTYEHAASLDPRVGILTEDGLNRFRNALRNFCKAVAHRWGDHKAISAVLNDCRLTKALLPSFFDLPKRVK